MYLLIPYKKCPASQEASSPGSQIEMTCLSSQHPMSMLVSMLMGCLALVYLPLFRHEVFSNNRIRETDCFICDLCPVFNEVLHKVDALFPRSCFKGGLRPYVFGPMQTGVDIRAS